MSDITVALANSVIGANLSNTPLTVDVQSSAPILVDVTVPGMTVAVAPPSEIDVTLSGVGQPGPPGVPGSPGAAGDGGFTHTQTTPAATWTISNLLGRYPASVSVFISGQLVDAYIETPNVSTIVVTFATPQSGRAEVI